MNTFKHISFLQPKLNRSNHTMNNNMVIQSQNLSVTMLGSLRTLSKAGKLRSKTQGPSYCRKICGLKYCRKPTGLCGLEYYVSALY
jgi:hypothetical protein